MSPELPSRITSLITALDRASNDSGKLAGRLLWLTAALVFVGVLQAVATAWPYLAWAWNNWI